MREYNKRSDEDGRGTGKSRDQDFTHWMRESGSEGADADSASENATTTMKVDKGVEKSDVMCDILLQSIACWCGCDVMG